MPVNILEACGEVEFKQGSWETGHRTCHPETRELCARIAICHIPYTLYTLPYTLFSDPVNLRALLS